MYCRFRWVIYRLHAMVEMVNDWNFTTPGCRAVWFLLVAPVSMTTTRMRNPVAVQLLAVKYHLGCMLLLKSDNNSMTKQPPKPAPVLLTASHFSVYLALHHLNRYNNQNILGYSRKCTPSVYMIYKPFRRSVCHNYMRGCGSIGGSGR
jgi:hypothetical protein